MAIAIPRSERTWDDLGYLLKESQRLKTYEDWPLSFIKPKELAAAGFLYTKVLDYVQCVFCSQIEGDWKYGDVPRLKHRECSRKASRNERENENITSVNRVTYPSVTRGRHEDDGPLYPNLSTERARMRTFELNWLEERNWENCVLAGFYYTGITDHVMCFSCGLGLRNLYHEDPWTLHALYSPRCTYLLLVMGRKFVQDIHSEADKEDIAVKAVLARGVPIQFVRTALTNVYDNCVGKEEEKVIDLYEACLDEIMATPVVKKVVEKVPKVFVRRAVEKRLKKGRGGVYTRPNYLFRASTLVQEQHKNLVRNNNYLCKICFDRELQVAFMPCGHFISCEVCAMNVNICPNCRININGTRKIYF